MNRKQRRAGKAQTSSSPAASPAAPLFAQAVALHQAGRLAEAEQLYRRVLAEAPRHADALHLLGVLAGQVGRQDVAADLIGQAIAIAPGIEAFHSNLGLALQGLGRLDEAVASYRRGIALNPRSPEAHNNLGLTLRDQGRLDEAVACFKKALAIRADFPEVRNNLGLTLQDLGRRDEAEQCFSEALRLQPAYADALYNLGNLLQQSGRLQEAAARYEAAIAQAPHHARAYNNLGLVLHELERLDEAETWFRRGLEHWPDDARAHTNLGLVLQAGQRPDEAEACFRQALALAPDNAEALNNLGNLLSDREQFAEAASHYRRAMALKPDFAEVHSNLGNCLSRLDRPEEALACYRDAIARQPHFPKAHYNAGLVLQEQERLDEAVEWYRKAIAQRPDYPDAHNNLAMALLALGRYAEGWAEYEWRWKTPNGLKVRRAFSQPLWRGEEAPGKVLLLHGEQGFGDSLQFCRYAPLAAARGLAVILMVQKPLVRLMGSLAGVARVISYDDPLPDFDYHCPLLSMPLALGTDRHSIPAATPYLAPALRDVARWRARLAELPQQGPRVGLVWAGNPRLHLAQAAAVDRRRSMPPAHLAPLLALPQIAFFSLQKDGPRGQPPLLDLMDEVGDFADTAALVANLDLVISVDTSVAHLAGAIGKPVWLLDRFDACWRWQRGHPGSPWYPQLRLFRQSRPGDWDGVVRRVTAELAALMAR